MGYRDELKWGTKRGRRGYIPDRFQALVASITAAFLYFNIFQLLFSPKLDSGNCGSLLRPSFVSEDGATIGWLWNTGISLFRVNEDLICPLTHLSLWWEFFGSFAALAICGRVLRRAINRELNATS